MSVSVLPFFGVFPPITAPAPGVPVTHSGFPPYNVGYNVQCVVVPASDMLYPISIIETNMSEAKKYTGYWVQLPTCRSFSPSAKLQTCGSLNVFCVIILISP